MVENICRRLINRVWRSYASDLDEAPKQEGIYTIGYKDRSIYVGRSKDINRRLKEHKHHDLKVDKFIKAQFISNGGENLQFKWVPEPRSTCTEGQYIKCMEKKLKYPLEFNMRGGSTCKRTR